MACLGCSGSAQACSPSAQVKAAVAHVRRLKQNQRKGKLILSLWVSGTELSVVKSSTKEGFSPQSIYPAPMQPSSFKGALQPRTTPPAERRRERIQSYPKTTKHISETCDEAGVPIISTEPPLSRLTSAQNTQPDEYMDDSDSSATLSSSRSTLSSSTTSILSADGIIGTYSRMLYGDSGLLSLSFRGHYYFGSRLMTLWKYDRHVIS
jgi:hypothetical protein